SPQVIRRTPSAPYSTSASRSGWAAAWYITARCGPSGTRTAPRRNSMSCDGRASSTTWAWRRARVYSRARSSRVRRASSTRGPYYPRATLAPERGREQLLYLGELGRGGWVARDVLAPGLARGGLVVEVEADPAQEVERVAKPRHWLACALLGLGGQ